MLIVINSVVLLGSLFLLYKYERLRKTYRETVRTSSRLISQQFNKVRELEGDIAAIEVGHLEIEDSYEQQFLSFREKISAQENTINYLHAVNAELEETVAYHREFCLPVLEPNLFTPE